MYTLRARDPENTPVQYYISGDYFTVEKDTGVVKLIKKLDRESVSSVDVIISITDQGFAGLQPNTVMHFTLMVKISQIPTILVTI